MVTLVSCSPSHDSSLELGSSDTFMLNPNPNQNLSSAAQTVLTNRCYSCHGPSGSNSPIFESDNGSVDMDALTQNKRYVSIGDPKASFLHQAIFSVDMPTSPPSDTFLSSVSEQKNIELWIADIGIPDTSGGGNPPIATATFTEVENQVLTPFCYSCHDTQFPMFTDFASIRSVMVIPNNPDSAFLRVITEPDPTRRMPKNMGPLDPTLIDLVESWILNGALQN